jgi:hypothetical protein
MANRDKIVQLTIEQIRFLVGELQENHREDYHLLTREEDTMSQDDLQYVEDAVKMRNTILNVLSSVTTS